MRHTAGRLVGHDVVLTILNKRLECKFKKKVKIIGVLDDFIRAKGASGMETAIPMDDE
jgi:hypothetical protein